MYPRSLKLLDHLLKVILQDGDQIGFQVFCLPLQCSVHYSEGYAQGGAGIRRPGGACRWAGNGGNIIGEDGWAHPGCSPINLASGQLTSRSSVSPAA